MLFAFEKLPGIVILIFYLNGCHATDFSYVKLVKGSIQGKVPSRGFLDESYTRNKIDCARTCTENQDCAAVYFLRDTKACKTHAQKISEINDGLLLSYQDAVYYEVDRNAATLTDNNPCPIDDSTFSTVRTGSGTLFQFRFFMDVARNFSEADALCQGHGAKLYKLLTNDKFDFTIKLMACAAYNSSNFWINGIYNAGSYETLDGEPIAQPSAFWAPNRPNNGANEPCLWIANNFGYYFDDRVCGPLPDHPAFSLCEI